MRKKGRDRQRVLFVGARYLANILQKYGGFDVYLTKHFGYSLTGSLKIFASLLSVRKTWNYDIVHVNAGNDLISSYTLPAKVRAFHAHGRQIGIYFEECKHLKSYEQKLFKNIEFLVQEAIRQADLFFVATPDIYESAKKIRHDAIWMPNPIDFEFFRDKGAKIRLSGRPAVFYPTRVTQLKNPEMGFRIYNEIRSCFPEANLHVVAWGNLSKYYMERFSGHRDIIWHNKISRKELPKYYRGADLVLGQFGFNYCSLIELEAAACGVPPVTWDEYEGIGQCKHSLEDFVAAGLHLLQNETFKTREVKKNLRIVRSTHSPSEAVNVIGENYNRAVLNK